MKEKPAQVEEILKSLIAKCLHRENFTIDPSCTFKDLGIDSLDVVHIMVSLEDSLNIEIVDKDLKTIKNMGAFIAYLDKKVAERRG